MGKTTKTGEVGKKLLGGNMYSSARSSCLSGSLPTPSLPAPRLLLVVRIKTENKNCSDMLTK